MTTEANMVTLDDKRRGATKRFEAMMLIDPIAAKKEIIKAFRDAHAHRGDLADFLGVSRKVLYGWIDRLGLADVLDRIEETAKKAGWHHGRLGGRPKDVGWSREERILRGKPLRSAARRQTVKRAKKKATTGTKRGKGKINIAR